MKNLGGELGKYMCQMTGFGVRMHQSNELFNVTEIFWLNHLANYVQVGERWFYLMWSIAAAKDALGTYL